MRPPKRSFPRRADTLSYYKTPILSTAKIFGKRIIRENKRQHKIMNNIYLETFLRTLFAITVMLILARINGAKEISQLNFFDYIVGITVGSIAASLAVDYDIDVWACLIGLVMFMLSSIVISFITNKSMILRRVINGAPIVLIKNGEILYDGLKRARFDINDMLRELRSQGYFDVTAINCAILETNGKLSVMLKSAERPATAAESGLNPEQDDVPCDVIIDGKILGGNLESIGKTADWLEGELKKQGVEKRKDVLLATYSEGSLNVFEKKSSEKRTVFQ